MEVYVGYGFSADDLSNKDLFNFVRKYEGEEEVKKMAAEALEEERIDSLEKLSAEELERVVEYTRDWVEEEELVPDYLTRVINEDAKEEIFGTCGDYIVFYSIRFVGDPENRTRIIQNEEDFVRFVHKYLPDAKITCGNVYDGTSRHTYPFME